MMRRSCSCVCVCKTLEGISVHLLRHVSALPADASYDLSYFLALP